MIELRGNYKGGAICDNDILCVGCGVVKEDNRHVAICQAYDDLREGKDLTLYDDLLEYYRLVMERRMELTS